MSLSLAVSAGAAFNDQDKIVNEEAVGMCVALNIINGRTNGDFDPAGNVTRAEMAKMICIVLNGGKEPVTSTKAVPTFADIDGHWAEGYIEYCFAKGVVAGKSATEFAPNAGVTGTEAAKMLLVALGYNADVEKMVGANWALYTNVLANQDGLYEELEAMDPGAALSRDNAAQMIWNALQSGVVTVESSIDRNDGSIVDTYAKTTNKLLTEKYSATPVFARLVDAAYDSDEGEYTYSYIEMTEDYAFKGAVKEVVSETDYSDLFLNNVTIVLDKNGDVMGIYGEDTTVLATATIDEIDDVDGDTKITIAGTEYKLNDEDCDISFIEYMTTEDADKGTYATYASAPQFEVALYDGNDDGKGDYFVIYPFSVAQVGYVGTKSVSINSTSYTYEDNSVYEGIAKDDYAVIVLGKHSVANSTVANEDAVITKAELTTAKVTGIKADAVQLDGTWYTEVVSAAFAVGTSYDMVIMNNVVLTATEVEGSSDDILYVQVVDSTPNTVLGETEKTWDAKVYFADGTAAGVVVVSEVDDVEGAAPKAGYLYTYTKSGDNYVLETVDRDNVAAYDSYATYKGGFNATTDKVDTYRVADDAVIFVHNKDGVKVITGKEMKDWSANFGARSELLIAETNGINYVQVAALIDTLVAQPGADADTQYGYVTDTPYETSIVDDGEDVAVVAVQTWNGSESVTLYVKGDLEKVTIADGTAFAYKVDGQFATIEATYTTEYAITGFDYTAEGDIVYTDGTTSAEKVLDKDVVFIGVDTENTEGDSIVMADVQLAQTKTTEGVYTPNAYIALNTDGKVIAVFWDIANEIAE